MDGNVNKGRKSDEEALLQEARDRFKLAVEGESHNRSEALDDLEFLSGEQWTNDAKKLRAGRPCLTINRLPQFIRSVVNEQRKTRPAIDVIPADGVGSKETADVLQGLIRHIERSSRAKIAYDTAFKYAVSCGFGHFKITTDYVDDDSFDQEIKIECTVCHMPHRSFMKPLLVTYVDSINDLCLNCHARIRSGHIVIGFSGKNHPVQTNKPVLVDGRLIKLSCISCHNPHSSESGRLFNYQARTSFELCEYCHMK